MRFIGFIGPSYTLSSKNVDCQRCVNLYPELDELGTGKEKEIAALVSTPGLRLLATVGTGPGRGTYRATNGEFYFVSGNTIYKILSDWTSTTLGTLDTSFGPISFADDGLNLILVDGPSGYDWNFSTSTFAKITDPAFVGADQVTEQDGYFIFNAPDSDQFYLSATPIPDQDPTLMITFDSDVATSEGCADNIIGLISDHRNLWLFNAQTTEVFYNSGDVFPFTRIEGAYIEVGCAARFSIAKMNNTVYWVGCDERGQGMVFQAAGYTPTRISTHPLELAIQGYGDISGATSYTYQQNGHYFYVLNFPSANTTWVFDSTTKLWHERTFTNQGNLERHRGNFHAFPFNTHVVCDYVNGNLYELSTNTYSDNGTEITRMRVSPHLGQDLKRNFYESFQLDIESGVGLDGIGQGTDPQIMLQWSDDGGHSWSNEHWVSCGKIGVTRKRALWRRLGLSRDRVFKVKITDPVKVTLIGAEVHLTPGVN